MSDGVRRYTAFADELRRVFGCRVQRVSVDAGFTCPNRDGAAGTGGCIFCGGKGSGSFGIRPELSVADQLLHGKEFLARRYGARKFLAYFQSYSNTYAPPERLRLLYDEALAVPDVAGLIVGTRPDCLPPDVLDLLMEYARKTYFWLELGLQSSLDRTLTLLNRGHDVASFAAAARRCRERGIRLCAHVILGLPGESCEEMLGTAGMLNDLGVDGVKIHHLHVMKDSPLDAMYRQGEVRCLERDDYVGLACDFLERLDPRIVIHRLVGDAPADHLVAPAWTLDKAGVLGAIDGELERRATRQGTMLERVMQ
ncbi:MAG: TIGR01212 family radical SAM protein [Desulfuromonadales bacterium]|nr:MAG: TIGR01212 family radical SAM protein [Desulfuromonadales bacterium]